MKLITQPDDGVGELIEAIAEAKKSIEIMIFRFDHKGLERALVEAVKRGVAVQALIAFTNRGGESRLRGLEQRLLGAGAVVARTNNDLARYHGKFMIVDHKRLYVLGFNFTSSDIERSRSFGVVIKDSKLVAEAGKLFSLDCLRQPFAVNSESLIVSPTNSRKRLGDFLRGATKEILIFDLEVSDSEMIDILRDRATNGVAVRIIGSAKLNAPGVEIRSSHPLRLHARVIVRDGEELFIGSQSLRRLELDSRREVGVILREEKLASQVAKVFEQDWESAKSADVPADKVAKKVAKAVSNDLPQVSELLERAVAKNGKKMNVNHEHLQEVVKEAVKNAVRDAVQEAVTEEPVAS